MNVYLLSYGRPHPAEQATPVGVFSTFDIAKAYAENHNLDNWEVAEWEVDELLEEAPT